MAGVQLDSGKDGFTGGSGSSKRGSGSIGSSSNWTSWKESRGKTSIGSWAKSGKLGRSLGPDLLSLKSGKESSLGLSNLRGINNWGWVENWGNWESSVVNRGNWEVVSSNSESKIISNIVDSVDSSLISISVRSSHSSVSVSLFLLGRVNVLVSVSKVAELILSLELRADGASNRGSNGGGNSNRSSSISSWGSSDSRSSSNNGSSSSNRSSSQRSSIKSSD